MSWPQRPLSELCTRITDGTHQAPKFQSHGIPFLFVSNIDEGCISFETSKYISAAAHHELTRRCPIEVGDVLYTIVGSYGNAAVVRDPQPFSFQRHIAHLKPHASLLSSDYLAIALHSEFVRAQVDQLVRGVAQKTLNLTELKALQIPAPPVAEQRRIADVLNLAELLRAKRRKSFTELDILSQAIFLELFGDPATNPKRWPETQSLGDVAEIVSGITKGRPTPPKETREVPYLAVVNVQDRALNLGAVKKIEATEDEIRRYRLMPDDLLLTEGGDPDKLGRGSLWNSELPECIHQNHIFRVRLTTDRVHPLFLNWLVSSQRGKRYFLRSAKQTTGIASINMSQLRGFPLLLPPVGLQLEFVSRIATVNRLRVAHQASLAEMDALFASLQHRAFRGEL